MTNSQTSLVRDTVIAGALGALTYALWVGKFFAKAHPVIAVIPGLATLVLAVDILDVAHGKQTGLIDTMLE